MLLSELVRNIPHTGQYNDVTVTYPTSDSRRVTPQSVYFCLSGTSSDGHDYAKQAAKCGAAAIICERPLGLPNEIVTENTHEAYAVACGNFYGNPQDSLKLIGVTGTNGKTTVTYLLRDTLRLFGKRVGMIGTVETDIDGMIAPAKYTTPDPFLFFSLLAQMKNAGCEYAVMETSSHGLDQRRTGACRFAAGIFTNLSQDHLDYHKTMENYFAAKRRLFSLCNVGIVNADDAWGRRLCNEIKDIPMRTFSALGDNTTDYIAKNIKMSPCGSELDIFAGRNTCRLEFPVPGDFSIANAMAALACLCELGFPMEKTAKYLGQTHGVPGRFEVIQANVPYTIVRDYAHAPAAIEKVLTALRMTTDGRIVILFGCPGRRDRTKRKKMADAAARLADFVILTSDNPREESEQQIIDDALPGLEAHNTPYKIIHDRYEAISWALENAKSGDTLLLAGKGHEEYQVLSYATVHFDEREIVHELLEKMQSRAAKEG